MGPHRAKKQSLINRGELLTAPEGYEDKTDYTKPNTKSVCNAKCYNSLQYQHRIVHDPSRKQLESDSTHTTPRFLQTAQVHIAARPYVHPR